MKRTSDKLHKNQTGSQDTANPDKWAEESQRENAEKYQNIFKNIHDGCFELDLAGNFTFFNDSVCRILGYSRKELMEMNYRHYTDKENAKIISEAYSKVYNTREPSKGFHWEVTRKDGAKRHIETSVALQKDLSGKPTGFIGIVNDITERKQAEDNLRQEQQFSKLVLDSLPGIFYLYTYPENRLVLWNKQVETLLGFNAEDIKGRLVKEWFSPENREAALKAIEEVMEKGQNSIEASLMTKDGHQIPFFLTGVRFDVPGQLYFMGIGTDISERKRAEEKLQQSLSSLRNAVVVTIQVLASTVEARDPYTAGHQKRVADLARAIATEMGLPQDKIEGIRLAGSIHDIGKLSIPAEILSKPSRLINIEFSLVKEHSKSGYEMLKNVESPWPLAEIVYQHHERMDGSGYPRNLKGDEIIMEARIMAVADVVEAMVSHRPYRPSLGIETALEEIEKNKGVLYDNDVADACLRLFREKGYQLK